VGDEEYLFSEDSEVQAAILEMLDIDGNGVLDADDAYLILLYYAEKSVGGSPDWDTLLQETAAKNDAETETDTETETTDPEEPEPEDSESIDTQVIDVLVEAR
jgi:hypothetical protein